MVIKYSDSFRFVLGMEGVWSTHVEMHYILPLAYVGFVRQKREAFCVLDGMGGVLSTLDEIHFVLNTS